MNERKGVSRAWSAHAHPSVAVLLALPLVLVLVTLLLFPAVKLVADSIVLGDGMGNYAEFFVNPVSRRAFFTTLRLGLVVTAFAVAMSWIVAWYLAHTQSKFWRTLLWIATIGPLAMGVVVKTYVFGVALQSNGLVNSALSALGFIDEPLELLYTETAVVIGMVYTMLPFGILPLYVSASQVDRQVLAASTGLGASKLATVIRVVVPLMRPAVFSAAMLVFVIAIGFYVTPILLGGPESPFVASLVQSDIYVYNDFASAATSSSVLLLTATLILGIGWLFVAWRKVRGRGKL